MNKADSEYVIVGKLGATYGVKGWLKIHTFTETAKAILDYRPWYLEEGNGWKQVGVSAGREHGKTIVAQLEGLTTPEQARLFTGKKIAVKRSQLPVLAKDEYYWSDLEGLTVINHRTTVLGTVSHLIETGSNDVLVVKGQNGECAIPYLPGRVVTEIDLAKRVMHVDWDLI